MKTDAKKLLRRCGTIICALIIAALSFLFFTNDFGLVDLRKTSVVIGVGLDREGDELELTAQLAVPQAAENGAETKFETIVGRGATVAEALNEINVRTGFYPKLVFCELILLGESCLGEDVYGTLDYFYRNEYTGLTPKVAACKGSAGEALSRNLPLGVSATDAIIRLLSEEAERSANVSTVNLRDVGANGYSPSSFCYMPYITTDESQDGEGGSAQSGGSQGGEENSAKSQEEGGGSRSEQSQGGQIAKSGAQNEGFVCSSCALFSDGKFVGVLDERLTFAYNLINGEVRHAFLRCGQGENLLVMGLRDCRGGAKLGLDGDKPTLKLSFSAIARVQDGESNPTPESEGRKVASEEELALCRTELEGLFSGLFENSKSLGCDIFSARTQLYRRFRNSYERFEGSILSDLALNVEVKLRSAA